MCKVESKERGRRGIMWQFESKEVCESLCFHSKSECAGGRKLVVWDGVCGACAARVRRGCGAGAARPPCNWGHSFSLNFWCVQLYWGKQLQIARRIGRRVQRLRKGKPCAAYYWGMQLQSARRIGRRVQRLRKGKQCAAYYWGMQLQSARRM